VTAGRHAWIDASAGVSGDMLLGALVDAGADLDAVQRAVDAVIPGAVRIVRAAVTRAGLRAVKVDVEQLVDDPPHRTWQEIRSLLAVLPSPVREHATAVFARLAAAEAHVHGVPVSDVHFHEVGALDSIADVVGVCAALVDLGIETVTAGEVALGSGRVRTAHGELPVPAPAVAELARGWRVRAGGKGELATPTGMAVLRALAATCAELPEMVVDTVGVGAGGRDVPGRPNVVRVIIGAAAPASSAEPEPVSPPEPFAPPKPNSPSGSDSASRPGPDSTPPPESDSMPPPGPDSAPRAGDRAAAEPAVLLEANVDDLDPRLWPGVLAGLLESGAADAWIVPIVMKKGRPAHTLTVLCDPGRASALRSQIFRDTTTLGVREGPLRKTVLARCFVDVELPGGTVAIKVGHAAGVIVQVMPEFDHVAALARRQGRPERLVLQDATNAAAAAGLIVGSPRPTDARQQTQR
jgi:uncharacterized protein (TIGR00299 family) protein